MCAECERSQYKVFYLMSSISEWLANVTSCAFSGKGRLTEILPVILKLPAT